MPSLGPPGPEKKLGCRTVKPKARVLSGAFGSKLTGQKCWFWVFGGGLQLFQKHLLLRGAWPTPAQSRAGQPPGRNSPQEGGELWQGTSRRTLLSGLVSALMPASSVPVHVCPLVNASVCSSTRCVRECLRVLTHSAFLCTLLDLS